MGKQKQMGQAIPMPKPQQPQEVLLGAENLTVLLKVSRMADGRVIRRFYGVEGAIKGQFLAANLVQTPQAKAPQPKAAPAVSSVEEVKKG